MSFLSKLTGSSDDDKEKVNDCKIVPYDEWHEDCYACGRNIEHSSKKRGQFVVHRDEATEHTAAVGLCEKCTRHFSTLIEQWEKFEPTMDTRVEDGEVKEL